MNQLISKYKERLLAPVSPSSLGLFRILVGIILMLQTMYFISTDFVQVHIFDSPIAFKFRYFEFLEPFSPSGMKFLMLVMFLSTIGIIFGRLFKISAALYGLTFTYFWLLDMSYFNNHYYFISLLALLLFLSNADGWGSLKGKNRKESIPYYQVFALKGQIFITFFIAGLNKLNYYWLVENQPMKHILETKAEIAGTTWINNSFFYNFFSWSGLLFDLFIGFLLWIPRFRKIGIISFLAFNLINFWLFYDIGEIGFFPFLLLACMAIFLDPEKVASKLHWLSPEKKKNKKDKKDAFPSVTPLKWAPLLITIYLVFHMVIPFRHMLYPDHVDWNGVGQRFSWRMKIMYKDVDMHFYLIEEGSTEKREVNVGHFLNDKQYTNLMYYPDFIPPVARYIREEGIRQGLKNPQVVADFTVGFNGDKKRLLVDPKTDLAKVKYQPGETLRWLKTSK
ncbi:HTTM domain-containing protein [Crocinitomicaceae bacterium]|nr:HTTM domain-containing protein [Crocinitomicaceae bacterium]